MAGRPAKKPEEAEIEATKTNGGEVASVVKVTVIVTKDLAEEIYKVGEQLVRRIPEWLSFNEADVLRYLLMCGLKYNAGVGMMPQAPSYQPPPQEQQPTMQPQPPQAPQEEKRGFFGRKAKPQPGFGSGY